MLKRLLAVAAVGLLMIVNVALLLARGTTRQPRLDVSNAWRLPFAGAQSAVLTTLAPGARPVIVVQTPSDVALVTPQGKLARSIALGDVISLATGDLNGDGADEILLLRARPLRVQARGAELQPLWGVDLPAAARPPSRVLCADLDGDGRAEVVVGGPLGLQAFDAAGRALWAHPFEEAAGEQGELRGLDDLRVGDGARRVVAARRDGLLLVLGAQGQVVLQRAGPEIRRLRAGNADDERRGELLVGYDSGSFSALDESGRPRVVASLGEPVVEIRRVETDGRRETSEIALGGKGGAVKLVRGGQTLFEARVGARVSELSGVDVDGDGRDELVVGAEDASLTVFDAAGDVVTHFRVDARPERVVPAGSARGPRQIMVASGAQVGAYRVDATPPPMWHSPLLAGLFGLAGLLAFGVALHFAPRHDAPSPTPADAAQAPARHALARLDELVAAGHLGAEQVAERRAQVERALASAAPAAPAAAAAPVAVSRPSPPPPPRRRA